MDLCCLNIPGTPATSVYTVVNHIGDSSLFQQRDNISELDLQPFTISELSVANKNKIGGWLVQGNKSQMQIPGFHKEKDGLLENLFSSSVVGVLSGSRTWPGAHTSVRIFFPTYCSSAQLLDNEFFPVVIYNFIIFSSWPSIIYEVAICHNLEELNRTGQSPRETCGLCLKCSDEF